jgi:hypothetical protein
MSDRARTVHRAVAIGAAIIVATNTVALLGVAYNRSGEPDGLLELSERELRLPYDWPDDRDDSGLSLRLEWRVADPDTLDRIDGASRGRLAVIWYPTRNPIWLDSAKLTAIGFDLTRPLDAEGAPDYYRRALPKRAYVVLELDGPAADTARERTRAWVARQEAIAHASAGADDLARRLEQIRSQLQTELLEGSRLFAVDAGRDRAALRAIYPDRRRYAVLPGLVALRLTGPDTALRLEGYIQRLLIEQINVPRAFRPVFDSLPRRRPGDSGPGQPYTVTVAFGRRLEPWIAAAKGGR